MSVLSSIQTLNEAPDELSGQRRLVWWPQPGPQEALFWTRVEEVFFGGARGGGKTDGVLGKWGFKAQALGSRFNGVIFRQTMPSTDDLWDRACEIYTKTGAIPHHHEHTIYFREGGHVRFRPLERVQDADKYQGQNLSDVWIEEAALHASPDPIDRLWGAMRGSGQVQMIMTGNPGGSGQFWVKERFIDPWPVGNRIIQIILPNGAVHRRIYIPSKIEDNKILMERDPQYINRLYLVGHPNLVKAWLLGDWDAVEGAYFDGWSPRKHVIAPFTIPKDWVRYCSMDWGSAKPFSIGWHAIVGDDYKLPDGRKLPRGCAVRYREWYGRSHRYNEGLKLTVEQVAAGIKEREGKDEHIKLRVADPSIFSTDGGPSHAERFSKMGVHWAKADNKRLPEVGKMVGWDLVRARLRGDGHDPMLVVFNTCTDLIRTLPVAQHDKTKPEDLDTDCEDHALDEERYFCAARPWMPPAPRDRVDRKPTDRYHPKPEISWKTL